MQTDRSSKLDNSGFIILAIGEKVLIFDSPCWWICSPPPYRMEEYLFFLIQRPFKRLAWCVGWNRYRNCGTFQRITSRPRPLVPESRVGSFLRHCTVHPPHTCNLRNTAHISTIHSQVYQRFSDIYNSSRGQTCHTTLIHFNILFLHSWIELGRKTEDGMMESSSCFKICTPPWHWETVTKFNCGFPRCLDGNLLDTWKWIVNELLFVSWVLIIMFRTWKVTVDNVTFFSPVISRDSHYPNIPPLSVADMIEWSFIWESHCNNIHSRKSRNKWQFF